jgi:hypothetical protein
MVCSIFLFSCAGKHKKDRAINGTSSTVITKKELPKPVVNVYVENSGSMDGYVKGVTEFEQIVYNYLTDIKITGIASSLNLFYINSKPILYGSDISDFIEKLEPTTFRQRGGNRGTTDLSYIIDTIVCSMNDSVVSILVSDCIFSPGKQRDAQNYLVNQQIGIKRILAEYAKNHPDVGIIAYRFLSKFNGIYYNRINAKQDIYSKERPFFIWVIGKRAYLTSLLQRIPDSKFDGKGAGVQQRYSIVAGGVNANYAVKQGAGYRLDRDNPRTGIVNAKLNRNGSITYRVEVDFSGLPLSDEYLCDAKNYTLSDNGYQVTKIIPIQTASKYTHALSVSSKSTKPTTLLIMLDMRLPEWIDKVNDDNGNALSDATMNKTFGIKYLYKGIYDAFTIQESAYTTIKININK